MTAYSIKETTTAADGTSTVVTRTFEWDTATEDALNAASFAAFMRMPDTALDMVVTRNLAALGRAQIDDVISKQVAAADRAADVVVATKAPRYVLPGDGTRALDSLDGILSVNTDGAVFRDGVRLGTAMVSMLCAYGATILGKGKTDGFVWKWDGAKWIKVDVDPSVVTWNAQPSGG